MLASCTGWMMQSDARGCRGAWWLPTWTWRYHIFFFHFLFFCVACAVVLPHQSPLDFLCCSYTLFSFCSPFLKFRYAALDSDDLLYLKEQMEAEEDAERLLRRTEKRAFAAFKISCCSHRNI